MSYSIPVLISSPITVVLGAHSLSAPEDTKQAFNVSQIVQHPQYNEHANDVMLLKVSISV